MSEEADNTSREPAAKPADSRGCPIVGIGASAGGIDALKRLFPHVDPDSGMAFVVVQHLDPHHSSALPEVLARSAPVPVTPIRNTTTIEPNHVYVIPPNAALTIQAGCLLLTTPHGPRGQRNPIDEFLTSLARDQGENAACVILSGTGSDGTQGLRAIKEAGGLTVAQAEAEYDGMMRSAVATGLVDFVLRAEEIPAKLAEYFDHVVETSEPQAADSMQADIARNLGAITALLHARTGHDFSNYKDRTIIRRVQRRMHVLQIDKASAFAERLRQDSRETALLFQDLLIGVTGFFRDPEAVAALEREVIPELFRGKGAGDTIRVWVPGCATGEEAYSIAILLREYAPRSQTAPRLQIFATDIDENALETARLGRYAAAIAGDIPAQRLERYFLREDGTYRIASDLREICLFSPHNLLRDAPFSKLDLISCRNLLIYLSGEMQDRVIPLFHYALVQDGFLFLGTSENVTRHSRLFATADKAHRIFRKRMQLERRVPEFPLTSPAASRRTVPPLPRTAAGEVTLKAAAERQVLDRFAPAHVVINAEGDLLQSSSRTGKYLELPPGAPDTNIFNLARPGLRMELRAAMHKAMGSGQVAMQRRITVGTNGGTQEIDLYVHPLKFGSASEPLYLVVFQDLGPILPPEEQKEAAEAGAVEEESVRHLEAELRATRERLQSTTEELESSNEELKSSNEELQSINEELQSANEELETSKEELQSINEELQTVNAELNARVEELSRANNDMSNLLESTQIATVFLDRGLLVKSFTPAAKDVFRLVESDTGRPIMHVRPRFEAEGLQEDAERVLRTLTTIERPVHSTENGARYIMRLLPYRTTDNIINGVVITFTDITRISAAEARINELTAALRARIDELETILELVPVGVMIALDGGDPAIRINAYGARLLGVEEQRKGLSPANTLRLFQDGEEVTGEMQPLERAMRTGQAISNWNGRLETERGESTHVMISATPLFGESGAVRGAVAAIVDISLHKQAEAQQKFLLGELQHRVKNILATVSSLATRMLRERPTIEEFRDAFIARLSAMSRTHDLLSSGAWSGASIRALLEAALEPYAAAGKDNIALTGGEVRLNPQPAAALGMVFHELATNAAKYGALSRASGRVEVAWRQQQEADGEPRLQLTWTEHGGPPVNASATTGFGSAFITRSVEYELAGKAVLEFRPEGVRCTIAFPLTGHTENPPAKVSP